MRRARAVAFAASVVLLAAAALLAVWWSAEGAPDVNRADVNHTSDEGAALARAPLGPPEVLPFSDRLVPGGFHPPAPIDHTGSRPEGLTIDAIGVAAPVGPVGLNPDGSAEVPRDISTAGWYAPLGVPRAEGSTVVVGHINGGGRPGVFHRLSEVRPGDEIVLSLDGAEPARYEVATVDRYPKDRAPLAELYTPTGPHRLVLITCGGEFNSLVGHYRDNTVVIAHPVGR